MIQEIEERILQEKEARFFFTLHAFEELVRQYGIKHIYEQMDYDVSYKIWKYLS